MVFVPIPPEQGLIVVEGWISDINEVQEIKLSRSNSFLGQANPIIANASVVVHMQYGPSFVYHHVERGIYQSLIKFKGVEGEAYQVVVQLLEGDRIISEWSRMPAKTDIVHLSINSFVENDPDNPSQNIIIYYPKVVARDSVGYDNYYRWVFFKNDRRLIDPESITLQNDRFFDGNLIPNLFDQFEYNDNEEIKIELHSINRDAFNFLNLLKSQITILGVSAKTTPTFINGNLINTTHPQEPVLGFFGTRAISIDSIVIQNN